MRNPKWHRDEIILALDLYFDIEKGAISAPNSKIIELSKILNKLPIHKEKPDSATFRNPNGVALKLSNFLAIDPAQPGKGMSAYSKLDKEIFYEFVDKRDLLKVQANHIKKIVQNEELTYKLYHIPNEEDSYYKVAEGGTLYKYHTYKERNQTIIKKKKKQHLAAHGNLNCEICGFSFLDTYGELGEDFIECHHKNALAENELPIETTLDDLMVVCANCHRMLHRMEDMDPEGLKEIIKLHRYLTTQSPNPPSPDPCV